MKNTFGIESRKELEPFLRDADHVDVKWVEGRVSLREFIASMFSYFPWWLRFLYRVREIFVYVLGLVKHEQPAVLPEFGPEDVSFELGESVFLFIIRSALEDVYWISETPEDRHLRAFLCIIADTVKDDLKRFYVVTIVHYKHWTGPVYFNIIRPFHHLVVSRMARAGVEGKKQK